MKQIANKLEELDKYFLTKSENEKWGMIIVVAGLITFIAYSYFLPYAEGLLKKSEQTKSRLEKNIQTQNTYLRSITVSGDRDYYVKKFNADIHNKENKIVRLKDTILYIDENLLKLSDMLFNQKSWATFLNSITTIADEQKVNLRYIKNKYVDSNGSFGYVLEIELGCNGKFKNIVQFMNELEQNTLVTDIYSSSYVKDKDKDGISTDIKVSVWGINH
jgi:hypothetical protein